MNEKMKRILFVMLMAVAAVGAWAKGEVGVCLARA